MEISEAFQQSQMSANHSSNHHNHHNSKHGSANGKSSPKRSPKCNGHVTVSGFHDFQDDPDQDFLHQTGDISFIPLQERGIFIKGMVEIGIFKRFEILFKKCAFCWRIIE